MEKLQSLLEVARANKNETEMYFLLKQIRDEAQVGTPARMNIVQYLFAKEGAGNGKLQHGMMPFPRTYVQLQLIFLVIPIVLCLMVGKPLLCDSTAEARTGARWFLLFLITIALIQGAIWDNYGASLGIWLFDQENMLGRFEFSHIPIEEYLWILNDTVLTYVFTLRLWTEFGGVAASSSSLSIETRKNKNEKHYVGLVILGLGTLYGVYLLLQPDKSFFFLGISLGFFCPFIMWQWSHSSHVFLSNFGIWLASWGVPGVWTYLADCVAVNQGIWVFDYKRFTSGVWVLKFVQVEVFLIYVIACIVCAQPALAVLGMYDVKQSPPPPPAAAAEKERRKKTL